MFWNKAKQTIEVERWAERLEAGVEGTPSDDPTLAMAAQLRTVEVARTTPNPFFKAQARRRLLMIHDELASARQRPTRQPRHRWLGEKQAWSQLPQKGLRFSGALAILCIVMLFFLWYPQPRLQPMLSTATQSPLAMQQSQSPATAAQQPPTPTDVMTTLVDAQPAPAAQAPVAESVAAAVEVVADSVEAIATKPGHNVAFMDRMQLAQPETGVQVTTDSSGNALAPNTLVVPATAAQAPAAIVANKSLGLAVGGAKDINNFRENIDQGYLPLPTDVTVEGLFYDYYFENGQQAACTQLFCPSYTQATSRDPISGEAQHFLAVGLNSGLQASDFARKRLNLVVVLDISGSMGEAFNQYTYDNNSNNSTTEPDATMPDANQWDGKPKIAVATAAIAALLDQLQADDRLAIVLFDDQGYLAKPLRTVGETDMGAIKQHILALREQGGTNMEAGYQMASDLLTGYANADPNLYENRIIFLTDAQPNAGATGQADLLALTQATAAQRIYTTFIGIGVDFNTQLIEGLTKVRGANYYATHSPTEFMRRMDDEFDFMVTPLLFDLTLTFNSPDFVIEQVYGSPEADAATGEVMRINTLFPSASRGGAVKGGLVLLQLGARNGAMANAGQATLTVTYADRAGNVQSSAATVALPATTTIAQGGDQFDNNGIRKGILLVRYANLLRNWINDERGQAAGLDDWNYPSVNTDQGIRLPQNPALGQWERQSMPLQISPTYRALFAQFHGYFMTEMGVVQDETLRQEVGILERLSE